MPDYEIAELPLGNGTIGIGAIPGRSGFYQADLAAILKWGADVVFTMTTGHELSRVEADTLGEDLTAAGVRWHHLPIRDFGAPDPDTDSLWPNAARDAHVALAAGGKVFSHCFGGCGRSGMALLRLMVEAGEDVDPALHRLRTTRSCAVEVEEQRIWASLPMQEHKGAS